MSGKDSHTPPLSDSLVGLQLPTQHSFPHKLKDESQQRGSATDTIRGHTNTPGHKTRQGCGMSGKDSHTPQLSDSLMGLQLPTQHSFPHKPKDESQQRGSATDTMRGHKTHVVTRHDKGVA